MRTRCRSQSGAGGWCATTSTSPSSQAVAPLQPAPRRARRPGLAQRTASSGAWPATGTPAHTSRGAEVPQQPTRRRPDDRDRRGSPRCSPAGAVRAPAAPARRRGRRCRSAPAASAAGVHQERLAVRAGDEKRVPLPDVDCRHSQRIAQHRAATACAAPTAIHAPESAHDRRGEPARRRRRVSESIGGRLAHHHTATASVVRRQQRDWRRRHPPGGPGHQVTRLELPTSTRRGQVRDVARTRPRAAPSPGASASTQSDAAAWTRPIAGTAARFSTSPAIVTRSNTYADTGISTSSTAAVARTMADRRRQPPRPDRAAASVPPPSAARRWRRTSARSRRRQSPAGSPAGCRTPPRATAWTGCGPLIDEAQREVDARHRRRPHDRRAAADHPGVRDQARAR